jgi:hypothetical protein
VGSVIISSASAVYSANPRNADGEVPIMRKRLTSTPETGRDGSADWLNLEGAVVVEVTSEDADFPIESALVLKETKGWRAALPGTQVVRLVFDQAQELRRISLVFEENQISRTQEFVLRWSSDGGRKFQEIVRQQWNFSPPTTNREIEEYRMELSDVSALELIIVPDITGGKAHASLRSLRLC